MKSTSPKKRVFLYIGSVTATAKILGISKGAVSQWSDEVPAEHCPALEKACDGTVKCEELNSKTDWAYLRGTNR